MKKNDLRNDPIKEAMLNSLSFLKKNIYVSLFASIVLIGGIVFALSKTSADNIQDYSACFDVSQNSDLEKYCEEESIKKILADIKKDKSSSQHTLLFLDDFSNMNKEEKLKALDALDFNKISSLYLKSMLYKIYGDILLDSSDIENNSQLAIEKYKKALGVFDDKKTYSALVNYKIAKIYKTEQKYKESKEFLDLALACDLPDNGSSVVDRNIKILESSLKHALNRGEN